MNSVVPISIEAAVESTRRERLMSEYKRSLHLYYTETDHKIAMSHGMRALTLSTELLGVNVQDL